MTAGPAAGPNDSQVDGLVADLVAAVGAANVLTDPTSLRLYGHDASTYRGEAPPVVCLPGGPSAAEMIFQVMARRVVAALKGFSRRGLATLAAVLGDRIEPRPENDHLVRVKLSGRDETVATPLFHRGIHREIAESDGVVLVPAGSAADKGQKVEVWLTR